MKKKFSSLVLCIAMMLTLVPQVIFAAGDEETSNATIVAPLTVNEEGGNGTVEPRSSRWHPEDVVEKENVPFTFYNTNKSATATKMVMGHYKKVAHYSVYNDGSGKRVHKYDTYYYTWTGYYRYHTTGTASSWIQDSKYTNVSEIYQDRGPVATLFGYLI